ncbi:MAG: 2-oxoglutarate dehydrogenase E1 component [Planctomycetota bacterium]
MSIPPKPVPPSVNGWNAEYVEQAYQRFLADPQSVSDGDRAFFAGFDLAAARSSPASGQAASAPAVASGAGHPSGLGSGFQVAVDRLIEAYRELGHIVAELDPFDRVRERPDALKLGHYGLTDSDLDRTASASGIGLGETATLRDIVQHLERTYCGSTGIEVMHLSNINERDWLLSKIETRGGRFDLNAEERIAVLRQLLQAETFETFLGKRYPGEKRFSLEGSESTIPLLDRVIDRLSQLGAQEVVIGMAHRGRLNVLNAILGKTYAQIFTEFEDSWEEDFSDGGGDVKYHRGYSGSRKYDDGRSVHLALASNPSHLEAVNPVVLGRCRAKQRLMGDKERRGVVPLLIHGDAAVAGQGIVSECLTLSQLRGYRVGGTVHVVINNMIGFTTSPEFARSSRYCTDIAKMIEAPVLHVNGEDPEAVVAAAELAAEYRQEFGKDVFIDLWCYRKYGHNEQDETSFTQPIMAKLIKDRPSVLSSYSDQLFNDGVLVREDLHQIKQMIDDALEEAQKHAKSQPYDPTIDPGSARWQGIKPVYTHAPTETGISMQTIEQIASALSTVPDGFTVNPKLKRVLKARGELPSTELLSYADAESLAYGSLLLDGVSVRLSGQDCRRGTFSHRHAVLRDYETDDTYKPLGNMLPQWEPSQGDFKPGEQQAEFCVHDSPLSEAGVLGFEYGYGLVDPNMLVLWEAQFGDFVNGAQAIIDQFIASAEAKWDRWNGLVMLLPHGYEGMGPEHSSGRMERFIKLCAQENLQVIYPSTGAQIFHAFRRQVARKFRKPLIVFSPKSLLRKPTSRLDEFTSGGFREMLDDPRFTESDAPSRDGVEKVILCTGKIFWELAERRDQLERDDIAIIRIEQIYPFHTDMMRELLAQYPESAEIVWVQEEPRNAGAGLFVADRMRSELAIELPFIGRAASPTPAVGSKRMHKLEQEKLLTDAIGPALSKAESDDGVATNSNGQAAPSGKRSAASA